MPAITSRRDLPPGRSNNPGRPVTTRDLPHPLLLTILKPKFPTPDPQPLDKFLLRWCLQSFGGVITIVVTLMLMPSPGTAGR